MSKLIIHHHLGLGDNIDCNAIVRFLSDGYESVDVFAKKSYATMVEYMYRDLDKINIVPVDGNEYDEVAKYLTEQPEDGVNFLRIGHENYPPNAPADKNCWELFYDQLNLPHEIKYEYFYIKSDEEEENRVYNKLNPNNEDFIFVHEESSMGVFPFDLETDMKIIRNDVEENIFHFTKILNKAKEIHVMESAFKSMAEHFPTEGKLVFHNNREHPLGKTKKDWEVIEYAS